MQLPPLGALRAFEAVARLGSFAGAAGELCVTQSAISHQIRNLEDWLGKPLFARQGNRTQLLPEGQVLAASLSQSLQSMDAACRRARSTSNALVIAAIPSIAMCWLIPRLSQFRAAYPHIETRIVYAIHGQEINFHDVHLAFVFAKGAPALPAVSATFFLAGDCAPVCSPALLQNRPQPPLGDAEIWQLGLLHDGSPDAWRNWLAHGEARALPAGIGPTFEDFNLLRVAALSGQGAALCPLAMVAPDLRDGNLVQLSPRLMHRGYDYYLLAAPSPDPHMAAQAALFQDWVMAQRG